MEIKYKYTIVGAGLSGLVTAYELLKSGEDDFIILEARDRVGGRILTDNHIDLGATWLQTYHATLLDLIEELNLKTFDQYAEGQSVLVYSSMSPAHYFEMDKSQPSSKRIVGGTFSLINALWEKLKHKIKLNMKVVSLHENHLGIHIHTENTDFISKKTVITIPPLLASEINYYPDLPENVVDAMEETHTWMSNAIKVGITYRKPFWRAKGFSGTVIGQASPVVELYDHCNYQNSVFALKGFVNESLRELKELDRKQRILAFLEEYLGEEIQDYISYIEKDWSEDVFTSGNQLKSYYLSPQYGNSVFQKMYYDSRLLFSGTETSKDYGGYLEGAVLSGQNAFNKIVNEI